MNRRSANAYDTDDSASDWDTTAAESPTKVNRTFSGTDVKEEDDEPDGDYATVKSVPRIIKGSSDSSQPPPQASPRKDVPKRKEEVFSPPPHLNSFKNALSDYSDAYEPAPNVPPKLYGDDEKSGVYAIPETDRSTTQVTVNWDDSDAEERVLQELRHNREREKDRQSSKQETGGGEEGEERGVQSQSQHQQLSAKNVSAADNLAFQPSPKASRSSKSVLEQWAKGNSDASALHSQNGGDKRGGGGRHAKSDRHKRMKTRKPALLPVTVQDAQGKKCVFYFEESNQHMLEAVDDDVDAFLPNKIDEVEMVYRRVWREIFSGVRIVTSFFVLFVTEFLSLVIHHILRPLVLESLTSLGNFFFKPLMTIVFNMFYQPFFALMWNVFNGLYMAADPLVRLLGAVCSKIAILLQSFQLFHFTYHSHHPHSNWKPPEVV